MILLQSPSSDPFFNVALEDYLVRNFDKGDEILLLLYENSDCVMLGKNQSIYKEVNFDFLRKENFTVARRISGGGTVYHGSGNLCFAFITKFTEKKINNYQFFNFPILKALNDANIPAHFNQRNDIVCNGYKISGNAQFTNRKNIISHGTLLFNADLQLLNGALKKNIFSVEAKSVDSVRSKVGNIFSFTDRFDTFNSFVEYLINSLPINEHLFLSENEVKNIEENAKAFFSDDWIYGRSPNTKITKNDLQIFVEKGKVVKVLQQGNEVFTKLYGAYYKYSNLLQILGKNDADRLF